MTAVEELVAAAQQDDDEAFGRLVEHYQDVAYYTAYRYLGDPQQAQDAAQEAFIDAYHCLPSLREPRAFPAWFRRIVFKHSHRILRRRSPDPIPDGKEHELTAGGAGPEGALEQMQRQQRVRMAVRSLPQIYRQVTTLFYLQGLSYAEIAERLDLPLSTVKKRLYTARKHLKEAIGPMTEKVDRPSQDDTFGNRVRFFLALKSDDLLQVRQLLRRQPELIHAKTEWGVASDGWYWPLGNTALHWAAGTGNEALAELLVEHGADVNDPDQMGKTPLVRAVHMGQTEMVRWLLQHGANRAGRTPSEGGGPTGLTPLHVAVIQNHADVAELLLAHGADASATDDEDRTPLDWAHVKGLPELVDLLGGEVPRETQPTEPRTFRPDRDDSLWETGIKAIDLMAPLQWGGRNGIFTPLSGVGLDVMVAELVERTASTFGGSTVQVGLEYGDFTEESRRLMWRNVGLGDSVDLFFGREGDSPARKRHLAERAVQRAVEVAETGPVLFLAYTHLALQERVMEILQRAHGHDLVTTLLVGSETIGAEPAALTDLDAAVTFDRGRARQGLWPAIDPIHSYSTTFASEEHERLATRAQRLFRRYRDLELIYENQGMDGFDMALYGQEERTAVIRARRLHRFLTQRLFVAEPWTGVPGEFVPLEKTLETAEAILEGELDDVPEDDLMFITHWSPRWT
ncbi:MAG: sigma-70 family RNA polymerase sigma factor [Candidatus Promineifilaceae bacterium]|nr:sigma-70 family RNA polymerase sigma factor [Candidatus Promineifilaceae bacterium]